MAEYIEREAMVKSLCNSCDGWCENTECDCVNCKSDHRCDIVVEIADFPAADVEPVRHATWKLEEFQVSPFDTDQVLICTQCGFVHQHDAWFNRCPNCGAKMDLEVSE